MISKSKRQELRDALEKCTQGEWKLLRGGSVNAVQATVGVYEATVADCGFSIVIEQRELEANADFIVLAHNSIRSLLDSLEEMEVLVGHLNAMYSPPHPVTADFAAAIQEHRNAICDEYIAEGQPPKVNWLYWKLCNARLELADSERLIDLQHSRTIAADKLWQEAHGKPNVLPDLGELVEWLMSRATQAEEERDRLKAENEALRLAIKRIGDSIEKTAIMLGAKEFQNSIDDREWLLRRELNVALQGDKR